MMSETLRYFAQSGKNPMRAAWPPLVALLVLTGCVSDPNYVRYGEMACERIAQDGPRRCMSIQTLQSERRVSRKLGDPEPTAEDWRIRFPGPQSERAE